MKSKILIALSALVLLFSSCKNESTTPKDDAINANDSITKIPVAINHSFTIDSEIKNLPVTDSTNFDNYKSTHVLKPFEIDSLQLKTILKDGSDYSLNYSLKLSDNFKTLVITYQKGEMELFTALINYDNNYKYINHLGIAYDETAESSSRIESLIEKNQIIVKETNYGEDDSKITKERYIIKSNGDIQKANKDHLVK
ncbi:hypothetical protein [Flavobacterium sp. '19STA2R22 D10 B1']|uniref:hypothetical protein n=1 Tax=Flavobacterium aerium TaxID=3037261 RepID=UPI00278C2EAF|nr:hypothetical protein [Flavobacterium sp. '19STA2R22 D10 B1']